MIKSLPIASKQQYAKVILVLFLLFYVLRLLSGKYITAILHQPLKSPELDNTFWVLLLTQIPQYISSHFYMASSIDVLIPIMLLVAIKYWNNKLVFIILLALLFLQYIVLDTYSCHHTKIIVVWFLVLFPLSLKPSLFEISLEFVRYYISFILVSACYFKIQNGGIFHINHFQTILIEQHIDLAILNPNHISYKVAQLLQSDIRLSYTAFAMLFLTQLSFIIAFFTKKMDVILVILLCLFASLTYLIMRIYLWELLLSVPCFLYRYKE